MAKTTVSADGTGLSYASHGSGEPPLVLVHGWMVTGRVWDDVIPHLAAAGRRVVVPSLRGAAPSAKAATDYAMERYVEDVVAVLEDAAPAGGAGLVGHSMGGQIAQLVAASRPELVDHLVLVSPVPVDGLALPDDAIALFRSAADSAEACETILKLASPGGSRAMYDAILADCTTVDSGCILGAFETFRTGASLEPLSSVRAATLVVASDDPFLPPAFLQEKIVDLIAGARLTHLPGPGHYIGNERPSELGQLICSFLRDGRDGTAG